MKGVARCFVFTVLPFGLSLVGHVVTKIICSIFLIAGGVLNISNHEKSVLSPAQVI